MPLLLQLANVPLLTNALVNSYMCNIKFHNSLDFWGQNFNVAKTYWVSIKSTQWVDGLLLMSQSIVANATSSRFTFHLVLGINCFQG